MTKAELSAEMTRLGVINNSGSRQGLWIEAFKLYNSEHPNKQVSMGCGTCYSIVKSWLLG